MTMSGNAFLYYGDEIGMLGKGKDENKRLGMRWTADTGAEGMCVGPEDAEKNIVQTYPALDEQLDAKMLEATLVSGETPVSAEG